MGNRNPSETNIAQTMIRQFGQAKLPVLITDLELDIIYANPYAERLFHSIELTDGIRLLLASDSVEESRRRLAAGESFRADFSPLHASNLSLSFSPLYEEEEVVGALVVLSISDERFQDPAEVVTRLGGSLLSASFRQPLSEIFATLSVMGRKLHAEDNHSYDQYLNTINKSSYQMLRNTGNIVSRLQPASGYRPPRQVVDFWAQTAELLEACHILLYNTNIPLNYSLPQEERQVDCFFQELACAIVNILSNAFRYTREGNEVTVTGRNLDQSVMLAISDRGTGISQELIDQVFSPYFSRGDSGMPYSGLGLGLNVARQAIYSNGGTIAVNSTEKQGTTVAFTLPITQAQADPRKPFECGSAAYLRDRFSAVYVGLCDITDPPEQ